MQKDMCRYKQDAFYQGSFKLLGTNGMRVNVNFTIIAFHTIFWMYFFMEANGQYHSWNNSFCTNKILYICNATIIGKY